MKTLELLIFTFAILIEIVILWNAVPKMKTAVNNWLTTRNFDPGQETRINTQKDITRVTVANLILLEKIRQDVVKYLLISITGLVLLAITIFWSIYVAQLWN